MRVSGLRIGAALQQVGGVVAARVGDHRRHRLGRQLVLALEMGRGDRRQRHHPRQRREVAVLVDASD